jgi:hypothetical protein
MVNKKGFVRRLIVSFNDVGSPGEVIQRRINGKIIMNG